MDRTFGQWVEDELGVEQTPAQLVTLVAMQNTLKNKEKRQMALYGRYDKNGNPVAEKTRLQPYDEIVITTGEQKGWTGTVMSIERSMNVNEAVVTCSMRRPTGGTVRVQHVASAVRKAQDQVTPPSFEDQDDADAWLLSQLDDRPQEYAVGAVVVFSCPPHLAQRITGKRRTKEWLDRHDDLEAEGRVTKYMPQCEGGDYVRFQSAYELLTLIDGEPELIEVAARRLLRLA